MELDRPSISRSGERPVTRWRREQEPSEKSQFSESASNEIVRPYSKMERPTSRRGLKTDITEYGISRPPTSGKNILSRPPSTSLISNRVPTPALRVNTMSSPSATRTNSALLRSYVQPNTKVLDRPVTQQGLAGMPPGSSKAIPRLAKQLQDKKYYEQLLQRKIQELNKEIETITRQVERQSNEKTTNTGYDTKVNDSATELNKLHDQINDYHLTFNKMISATNKEEIIQEATELKEFNDREEIKMKTIFQNREQIEKKLNELNKEIESRKKIAEKMIGNVNPERKSNYDELLKERNELQNELNILQKQQNQLSDEKAKMQEKIALSPIKQEAYKLYVKIIEAERKRDKLLELEKNNLTPENKEKLHKKSNQENLDIITAEKQIIEIEKKIANAEQELQQLETNTDEIQLEKSNKDNESHKQGEIMDIFMSSLEKSKTEELAKLNRLEEEIVEHLEEISNNITENLDSGVLIADEMEMLKSLMDQSVENRKEKNFEKLKQDNIKLREILSKLKKIRSKIKTERSNNGNNGKIMYNQSINDDSKAYDSLKEQQQQSTLQDNKVIKQEKKDNILKIMDEHYNKLKEKFEENEIYRSISILEDKLGRISLDDEHEHQSIKEHSELDKNDSSSLLEKLVSLTARYNTFLINEMKSVY